MGNSKSAETTETEQQSPRVFIRPAPGNNGVRVYKKNLLHVYNPSNGKIYVVATYHSMSVLELRGIISRLSNQSRFHLVLNGYLLQSHHTLYELGITEQSLV
jgi:hypothetical protein